MSFADSISILRKLPTALILRDRIIVDAIRYAACSVELSFGRAQESLLSLTKNDKATQMPFTELFTDAWSMVEATHRLRRSIVLLGEARQSKKVLEFLSATQSATDLRNSVQHLNAHIDSLVSCKQHAWGSIAWLSLESREPPIIQSHITAAGSMYDNYSIETINPGGKTFRADIDHVMIRVHGNEVALCETMRSVAWIIKDVSAQLADQFRALPNMGSDLYLRLTLKKSQDAS